MRTAGAEPRNNEGRAEARRYTRERSAQRELRHRKENGMKRLAMLLATAAVPLCLYACSTAPASDVPGATAKSTASDEDKQWTMQNKNYASTRYSGLDQVTT